MMCLMEAQVQGKAMTGVQIFFHAEPDAATLALRLAEAVAQALRDDISSRGRALLLVSGGSTPLPFFQALRLQALDWSKVTVTLVDERCVPPTSPDSNAALVRMHLLQDAAQAAQRLAWYHEGDTPEAAARRVGLALDALPWPATVTVLGMGADGHTASLFPHAPELVAALADTAPRCLAVSAPARPNVPVPRLTLTRRALLDTQRLVIHITGQGKLELLRKALAPGPVADWPIRVALQQPRVPCHVYSSTTA
jgi:6-phosphogluconolactonase